MDGIIMLRLLVLQQWYGLSDPELERQVSDRLSFQAFLGFPDTVPDYTTVWLFRERLIRSGRMETVWNELQRQLDLKGLKVNRALCRARPSSPQTRRQKGRDSERLHILLLHVKPKLDWCRCGIGWGTAD